MALLERFSGPTRQPDNSTHIAQNDENFVGTVYAASTAIDSTLYAVNGSNGQRLKWKFATPGGLYGIDTSPAIASDGTVYVTGDDTNVYALNGSTGNLVWRFAANGSVQLSLGPPALGADGTLYFGEEGGLLFALD